MGLARLHKAGALLVASLLLVVTAATDVHSACNATCERDVARCMATQCEGVGREACRRRCKPAAIRTLAYVLSECRVDAAGMEVGRQALRIRRGDREPISVFEVGPFGPVPAPMLGPTTVCEQYGLSGWGGFSVVSAPLQRLGVTPDGAGVVFEVNDQFSISSPLSPLPPEQDGMFFVRSDGSDLHRLGPASRDPVFRISPNNTGTATPFFVGFSGVPIPFSPNGRQIAFTDLGPGPGAQEAVQIFVLDLATGERTQVTHLPGGSPTEPGEFITAFPSFIDNKTVTFATIADPDGSNPQHEFAVFTVRIDGSNLQRKKLPATIAATSAQVVPVFGVFSLATKLSTLSVPGTPLNPYPSASEINEVFILNGKNVIQLTKFDRVDTSGMFLDVTRRRAFFRSSADPLGTNSSGDCQIFSIDTFGNRLRQISHFNLGTPLTLPAGCAYNGFPQRREIGNGLATEDPVTKAAVFDSTYDPLGANPYGNQAFAMRPDGSGLRQLTDAAGFTQNPDGSIRVELPGPLAYSAH